MCEQTIALLEGRKRFGRYAELGSNRSLLRSIERQARLLRSRRYSFTPTSVRISRAISWERGRLSKVWQLPPAGRLRTAGAPEGGIDILTVYIGFHHAPRERRDDFMRSCHKVLKRGGSLIVRDHDATDPSMVHLVALAHDVFNCGLELSWSTNAAEIRNFTSLQQLQESLETMGFRPHGSRLLQDGDPTRNTLMRFDKSLSDGENADEAVGPLPRSLACVRLPEYGPLGGPERGSVLLTLSRCLVSGVGARLVLDRRARPLLQAVDRPQGRHAHSHHRRRFLITCSDSRGFVGGLKALGLSILIFAGTMMAYRVGSLFA